MSTNHDALREAFSAFLLEQHERHKHQHNHFHAARNEWARRTQSTQYEALAASKPGQQAQAGEPEVVAWMRTGSSDGSPVVTEALLKRAPEYRSEYEEALITLQSHRDAITKKDAALQACVEALQMAKTIIVFNQRPTGNVGAATIAAAITHANQVLDRKEGE